MSANCNIVFFPLQIRCWLSTPPPLFSVVHKRSKSYRLQIQHCFRGDGVISKGCGTKFVQGTRNAPQNNKNVSKLLAFIVFTAKNLPNQSWTEPSFLLPCGWEKSDPGKFLIESPKIFETNQTWFCNRTLVRRSCRQARRLEVRNCFQTVSKWRKGTLSNRKTQKTNKQNNSNNGKIKNTSIWIQDKIRIALPPHKDTLRSYIAVNSNFNNGRLLFRKR